MRVFEQSRVGLGILVLDVPDRANRQPVQYDFVDGDRVMVMFFLEQAVQAEDGAAPVQAHDARAAVLGIDQQLDATVEQQVERFDLAVLAVYRFSGTVTRQTRGRESSAQGFQ